MRLLLCCSAEESKYSEGRIIQCFIYLRSGSVHDNHYAHPLDLVVFLDMNTGRVLDTLMQETPPVIPQLNTNYLAPLVQKERGFRSGTHAHIPIFWQTLQYTRGLFFKSGGPPGKSRVSVMAHRCIHFC